VKRVRIFKNIGAMAKAIPYRKIMPSVDSIAELKKAYSGYPGYTEKLKQCGVVAWNL
jgi:ASC-1-like (ASCH) protein